MKNIIKKISILIITFLILNILMPLTMLGSVSKAKVTAQNPVDIPVEKVDGLDALTNIGSSIIGVLSVAGTGIALVVLICIGIKYMVGSVEDKSDYKKSLMPYLVGVVILFSASLILGLLYKFAKAF